MRSQVGLMVGALVLVSHAPGWAAEVPVAVSPGDASGLARIGDRCPTFSWGAAEGAKRYELVVYRLDEESEEARPALRKRFHGSVTSWTPSLDRCLERGGRYAWSVRAMGRKEVSDWSPPSLFQVASGPSEVEFEEALSVVRAYIAGRHDMSVEVSGEIEDRSQSGDRQSTEANSAPPRGAPPPTALSVDGNVDATSFTGEGSGLTGVDADSVDGLHADTVTEPGILLALDSSAKLPASITGDANTLDGLDSSDLATQAAFDAHAIGNPNAHREHASLEESAEIDADIAAHSAIANAHREHASLEESTEIDADIATHVAVMNAHREHASLEESAEIDLEIANHGANTSAHHSQTSCNWAGLIFVSYGIDGGDAFCCGIEVICLFSLVSEMRIRDTCC